MASKAKRRAERACASTKFVIMTGDKPFSAEFPGFVTADTRSWDGDVNFTSDIWLAKIFHTRPDMERHKGSFQQRTKHTLFSHEAVFRLRTHEDEE